MTNELDIEALEAMEKAATPGPWDWFEDALYRTRVVRVKEEARRSGDFDNPEFWASPIIETDSGQYGPDEADRAFIAALRNAAPALIAAYREREGLKLARDEMQRQRAELYDKLNGTPCAEIRWQQERDDLAARASLLDEAEFANSTLVRKLAERDEQIAALTAKLQEAERERREALDNLGESQLSEQELTQAAHDLDLKIADLTAESASVRSRIDVLASALRPFAKEAKRYASDAWENDDSLTDHDGLTVGDFRRASSALENKP